MLDSKDVRSPAGQKLIKDLMLVDDGLEVGVVYDDVPVADEATTPSSRQRSQGRGALPLRPSNGAQRRVSLPVGRSAIGSAKTQQRIGADSDLAAGTLADRPATAPASSYMLLVPPQLPAARGPKDAKYATVSPLLERHLVSRHTSAYLGVVTAVLHQVSSPAATGAPRDTQRRPGTVPRDVYHHSVIAPPKRHHLSNAAASDSIPISPDGIYSSTAAACGIGLSRIAAPGSPNGQLRVFTKGGFDFQESSDVVGSSIYAPYGHDGGVGGSLSSRGRGASSGEYYVPYLDRSYGSHAPLACTVDALARRAEAHKALTRQRLLQKQLEQQMASGGLKLVQHAQHRAEQSQHSYQQHEQSSQQQQKKSQIVLLKPQYNEPYQMHMEGGVPPVALGLAWDTSPGVVAAAAAAAATTAAAIAARAEGLSASASPFLRDPAVSPSLRDFVLSPESRVSPGSRGNAAPNIGVSPPGSPQRRRNRGGGTPEWARPPTGLTGSGRSSPTGAPGSPPKVRLLPRTPHSAAEAAAMAAEAEELVRSHLPRAVRRAYNGQLAAQTIKDWETIAEPNRRMMQEIENATNLVRGSPSRSAAAPASYSSDGRSGRQASTIPTTPGSNSSKRYVGGQEVGVGAGSASAGGESPAAAAAGAATANSSHDGVPFGKHTSARSRRRYIRYSLDVFPELGLPSRSTSGSRATGAANGPFGTAGATAAAVAVAPRAMATGASGSWGPWEMSTAASSGLFGLDAEVSAAQMDVYSQPDYGEGEYGVQYGAAKGPRYVLAAAARVPVPIHLHPLPTPSAAIAAVVAGGGAAGAAAAALPQWIDPLAAAASGASSSLEMESALPGLQSSVSAASAMLLPAVGSGSQSSLHGSRGPSRTTSVAFGALSARGVGLQGCPSGPPLGSPSTSVLLDEPSGSWSAGGSGVAIISRNTSANRRHALQQSSKQAAGASGGGADEAIHRELSAGSSGTALRSVESQSASPQSTPRDERDDGPLRDVSTSVSSIAVGRGSPYLEPSLLPLAQSASTSILQSENSPGPLEPPAARTAAVTGTASQWSSGLAASGPIQGMDLDLDLDLGLGPAASSAGGIQRRDLDLFSNTVDSRLSTPSCRLPASAEAQGEGEAYDMSGREEEASAQVAYQDGGGRGEEGGRGFRERGFASTGPSGHHGTAPAAAAAAGAGAGTNMPEWDAGPTPRLISRPDGSRAGVPMSAVPPLLYRRMSSAASDTVGSASLGSATPRSGLVSAGTPFTEPSAARATTSLLGEGAAAAARARGSRDVIARIDGGANAGLGAADEGSMPPQRAVQDLGDLDLGDGERTAGFAFGEDTTRDISPGRAAAAAVIPQGPVLTHGTGYRVVTSVAASLVSEDPREAARLAAQRDLEAQLERSSEHTAKLKAASRATKALARAGSQHSSLPPTARPPISAMQPPGSGYSIVQHRASRMVLLPMEEPQGGALSVLDAPVPAPAEMEAMASAARAALAPAQPAMASRLGQSQAPGTPQRRFPQHLQSERDKHGNGTSLGQGAYMHIQATIEPGRTAQMQDLWAS